MTHKTEYYADLIFGKLKNYKYRKIYLEKKTLKRFIRLLSKED